MDVHIIAKRLLQKKSRKEAMCEIKGWDKGQRKERDSLNAGPVTLLKCFSCSSWNQGYPSAVCCG